MLLGSDGRDRTFVAVRKLLSDDALFRHMLTHGWVTRSGSIGRRIYPRRDEPQPSFEKGGIVFSVLRREEGQGLAEYALIGTLIAVVAVLAITFLGTTLSSLLSVIGHGI